MKKMIRYVLFVLFGAASMAALAEMKTVTLAVSGMTCSTCPLAVKKALNRVDGVSKADVSFEKSEAVVTFDGAKTDIDALIKACAATPYPCTLKN